MSCVEVRDRWRDSPERARSLFTVRAAISSARPSEVPRSFWDCLMCSYCRARFVPFLTPRGGIRSPFLRSPDRGLPRSIAGMRLECSCSRRRLAVPAAGEHLRSCFDHEGRDMAGKLDGKRIAFLATDGVEQVELVEPRKAIEDAGADTELLSLQGGEILGFNHLDHGDKLPVDKDVSDANVDDYDGLVIPGGVANGDFLRADPDAVEFVADFARAKKPIASICHGPWILVEAGIVKGHTITSWPSLQTDVRNAGGTWVDEEVHV